MELTAGLFTPLSINKKRPNDGFKTWYEMEGMLKETGEYASRLVILKGVIPNNLQLYNHQQKEFKTLDVSIANIPVNMSARETFEIILAQEYITIDQHELMEKLKEIDGIGDKYAENLLEHFGYDQFAEKVIQYYNPEQHKEQAKEIKISQKALVNLIDSVEKLDIMDNTVLTEFLKKIQENGLLAYHHKDITPYKLHIESWTQYALYVKQNGLHKEMDSIFDYFIQNPYSPLYALPFVENGSSLNSLKIGSKIQYSIDRNIDYLNKPRLEAYTYYQIEKIKFRDKDTFVEMNSDFFERIDEHIYNDTSIINRQWIDRDQIVDVHLFENDDKEKIKKYTKLNGQVGLLTRKDFELARNIAHNIHQRLETVNQCLGDNEELSSKFATILNYEQDQAIINALNKPVSILTGGPGTGKSHVVLSLATALLTDQYYHQYKGYVHLLTPTGRAAKRLNKDISDHIPLRAITIDSFLINPLLNYEDTEPGIIIIDETSMVDEVKLDLLLKLVPDRYHIVFTGDPDQLPSIQNGQVLHDLINSDVIPKVELTHIYRNTDTVAHNAQIMKNSFPETSLTYDKTFQKLPLKDFDSMASMIAKTYRKLMKNGDDFGEKFLFIAMQNKPTRDNISTIPLNKQIQINLGQHRLLKHVSNMQDYNKLHKEVIKERGIFNPTEIRLDGLSGNTAGKGYLFGVGDYVINTKNDRAPMSIVYKDQFRRQSPERLKYFYLTNKDRNEDTIAEFTPSNPIVNGDVGIVTDILVDGSVVVEFEGVKYPVLYEFGKGKTLNQLELAYVTNCYKAQGSQADYVLLFLSPYNHPNLNSKESVYTAATRAKKGFAVYEHPASHSFEKALTNIQGQRNTILCDILEQTQLEEEASDDR